MTELMQKLVDSGYPKEEFYHHYSDLYVFVFPITTKVISEWCESHGYRKEWFCSQFTDQITGKKMYDIAFNYSE